MIEATNINKSYQGIHILKNISLKIKKGDFIAIMGKSGAGKSTLLNLLSTIDRPDSGDIKLDNVSVLKRSNSYISKFRNENIGFVFQNHNLLPEFSVVENIALPSYIRGDKFSKANEEALKLLHILDIYEKKDFKPEELSGGEKQRVAIARAVINKPKIVFADEPTGSLDSENSKIIMNLFIKLRKEYNLTLILATHDKSLTTHSDRIINIKDGEIIEGANSIK